MFGGLCLAGGLLAGTIALELAAGGPAAPTFRAAAPVPGGPAVPAPDAAPGQVAALLARPPFSPDRKPDPVQGGADPRLPHLTGILLTREDREAIFAGRDGGIGTVVRPGDQLGPYRVEAISAEDVTLVGADGRHALRPTFSAGPPAAALPVGLSPPALAAPALLLPPLPPLPGAAR